MTKIRTCLNCGRIYLHIHDEDVPLLPDSDFCSKECADNYHEVAIKIGKWLEVDG